MSPYSLLRSLTVLSICAATCLPSEAIPGRLPGYSAKHVRHATSQLRRITNTRFASAGKRSRPAKAVKYARRLGKVSARVSSGKQSYSVKKTAAVGKNFIWEAPIASNALSDQAENMVQQAFASGRAQRYSPAMLTSAKVFTHVPMRGGMYKRRENVRYIILHSTETARVADAQRVIKSWSNRGLRHPGAQFVVDRDGTIYNTVDPTTYSTVHVDTRKTKKGINNDNSIGIEIVHTGNQEYTDRQVGAVAELVTYLQDRFSVNKNNILTHSFVQPSDRSDPVNFNWGKFAMDRSNLQNSETAYTRHSHAPYGVEGSSTEALD